MEDLDERKQTMPFLSDHTYQSAHFAFYNSQHHLVFSITGATWNLQDRGFAKKSEVPGSFSNNPWNINESINTYIQRKKAQINKIVDKIIPGKDFIFLQEIDFLVPDDTNIRKVPRETKHLLKKLLQHKLSKIEWRMLLTPKSKKGKIEFQPLGILYNGIKLSYKSQGRGLFSHERSGYRGYEWIFFHRTYRRTFALTNIHLAYETDYSQILIRYQQSQIEKNIFTIMGGDTNHPAQFLTTAISKYKYPTNLEQRDNYTALSHKDNRNNAIKDYDAFFVNPTKNTYVKLIEAESEYFKEIVTSE